MVQEQGLAHGFLDEHVQERCSANWNTSVRDLPLMAPSYEIGSGHA